MATEQDIFGKADELIRSSIIPMPEGATSADALDELQKHQLWLEHFNGIHANLPPMEGTMTFEELALLGAMRLKHPSVDDAIWAEHYRSAES